MNMKMDFIAINITSIAIYYSMCHTGSYYLVNAFSTINFVCVCCMCVCVCVCGVFVFVYVCLCVCVCVCVC